MSQAYLHACERAELLGLPKPSEEEWKETQRIEDENRANDEDDDVVIQNLDTSDEAAQRISGGLDELNSILNATQKKINRIRTVCTSLSTLLKVKVGSKHGTPDHKATERNHNETEINNTTETNDEQLTVDLSDDKETVGNIKSEPTPLKKINLNEKMGSHLDKLDSLISKAENAQYSMQHQTKQMREFLK
ncbi:uncharacterized protein LOC144471724 [Augochlora pura]